MIKHNVPNKEVFVLPTIEQAGKLLTKIEAWGKNSQDQKEVITYVCFQALLHFHKHGDATLMTAIIENGAKSERLTAISSWFKVFAPVKWMSASEKNPRAQFVKNTASEVPLLSENEAEGMAVLGEASANPYYEYFKEGAIPVFTSSIGNRVVSIYKDYQKSLKGEGRYEKSDVVTTPSEHLNAAMELIRQAGVILENNKEEIEAATKPKNEKGVAIAA